MKIVIDIPEQIYLNAKADLLCGGDILVKAIKNGILHETVTEFADRCRECGREKVLDKIRAELIAISEYDYIPTRNAMEIIDKYRGEDNDKR